MRNTTSRTEERCRGLGAGGRRRGRLSVGGGPDGGRGYREGAGRVGVRTDIGAAPRPARRRRPTRPGAPSPPCAVEAPDASEVSGRAPPDRTGAGRVTVAPSAPGSGGMTSVAGGSTPEEYVGRPDEALGVGVGFGSGTVTIGAPVLGAVPACAGTRAPDSFPVAVLRNAGAAAGTIAKRYRLGLEGLRRGEVLHLQIERLLLLRRARQR